MSYSSSPSDPHEVYQYSYMTQQTSYGHGYLTDGCTVLPSEDTNFWSNSPRTDSPSPNGQSPVVGPYQIYTPVTYQNDHRQAPYPSGTQVQNNFWTNYQETITDYDFSTGRPVTGFHTPFVRIVKRRMTANKKEKRRTLSINNAYADLRDCIPAIPVDTKLSKIKTLRLATSYISYLTGVLETGDPADGFKAELGSSGRKSSMNHVQVNECSTGQVSPKSDISEDLSNSRRVKGRTGWPQHVWALELKQD